MKYRNTKSGAFDSKREHRRADELRLFEKIGMISDLKFQVKFEIIPKQDRERACNYFADFTYMDGEEFIVEDSKGFRTPDYIIKRKLMKLVHGITIRET